MWQGFTIVIVSARNLMNCHLDDTYHFSCCISAITTLGVRRGLYLSVILFYFYLFKSIFIQVCPMLLRLLLSLLLLLLL